MHELKLNKLHDVSRIQQSRQREPSCCQCEEIKILINNNAVPRVEIEPTTVGLCNPLPLLPPRHDDLCMACMKF